MINNFIKTFFNDGEKMTFFYKILIAILVFIVAKILHYTIKKIIGKFIKLNSKSEYERTNKINSIVSIISSIFKYFIYFFAIVIVLALFGVNTASLIATAGIGGIVIAFGVQSIIKDLFGGIFILIDDQYNVGDDVKINGIEGTIIAINIRNTVIKGYDGSINTISNGGISLITNYSKNLQRSLIHFYFSNDVDLDRVKKIINETSAKFKNENPSIKKLPNYFGVTELGAYYIRITVEIWSIQSTQWNNEKKYREKLFLKFRDEGIKFVETINLKGDRIV